MKRSRSENGENPPGAKLNDQRPSSVTPASYLFTDENVLEMSVRTCFRFQSNAHAVSCVSLLGAVFKFLSRTQ